METTTKSNNTCGYLSITSPAGSPLPVKLHSVNGGILNGKYEILKSLIPQWQDNPKRKLCETNYL